MYSYPIQKRLFSLVRNEGRMKHLAALGIIIFTFIHSAKAQMDPSIPPKTSKISASVFAPTTENTLSAFSKEETDQFDYNDTKNGHMPVFARNIVTDISLSKGGTWSTLPNGDKVWMTKITAAGAEGLIPLLDQLYLPKGSCLHIYMPLKEEILGAFTNDNTPETRGFCPGVIHGESCVIEYYEPKDQKGRGILSINKVGYAYRWVNPLNKELKSGSATCEVNVVCSEGDNWRNQIRSVARVFVVSDQGEGFCSGAMVNNVRRDCTPYLLSAEHCTEGGVSALEFSQWVFYFNYEAPNCPDSVGPLSSIVNGCKKVADSQDGNGSSGSDFLLLQLNHSPASGLNIYYSGWDVSNTTPTSGVCIHHPAADIKKVSTYTTPATSSSWGNIASNTHWVVTWATTVHGHGVTEPGSSGSPLYGPAGLIVGHLTGGESCCTTDACGSGTSPSSPDYFGKTAYDWLKDGVSAPLQLKPWLDPDNTGATSLQGMNPPCGSSLQYDAGLQAINEPVGNLCSTNSTPALVLRNFGSNTLTSATISYKYDNGNFNTYNWTGTLFAGNTIAVNLPTATLAYGQHHFTAITTNPNSHADSNLSNDTLKTSFYVSGAAGSLNLVLKTDNSGSKTTWQIADASNNIVASGGPYPDLSGGTTYNIPFCLPGGCYVFTIFSQANNGMTDGVDGNFTLGDVAATTTYASLTTPSFGSSEVHDFCISSVGVENIPSLDLSIIPNPSSGQFNVMLQNNDEKSIKVYDITGRLIEERKTTEQSFSINLNNQSKGVYLLQIETANGKAVQKLVLK